MNRKYLVLTIAIVFSMFVGYGIETFYPDIKYNDYCDNKIDRKFLDTEAACNDVNGEWSPREYECPAGQDCASGYCNPNVECREAYDIDREAYDKNVFILTLVLGLGAIVAGGVFLGVEAVGAGVMGGGVLTVIYGTLRYWEHAPDVLRFVILGIVFATLIWIGYTKLNPDARAKINVSVSKEQVKKKTVKRKKK